jgi:hypothetical protein
MSDQRHRAGRLAKVGLLAALSLAGPGCLSWCHTVEPPAPELLEPCRCLPLCCKSKVHVFLIDGIDPFCAGDLGAVRSFLIDLGFIKTSFGQMYHAGYFGDQIRRIHKDDPDAQFVLIGFDRGAGSALELACDLAAEQAPLALVVFLDGQCLRELPPQSLPGTRVVHVRNAAGLWDVTDLRRAETVNVRDCGHFRLPTHPITLEVLAHELGNVAQTVPIPAPPVEELPPLFEPAPPPRPLDPASQTVALPADWNYLGPTERLRLPEEPAVTRGQLMSRTKPADELPPPTDGRKTP